jgi:NAD(P)-dependent dehydrogenase (short-subunit alcohol dehydrogenase family)
LFAAEGARIVVADLNERGGRETVETIKSAGGQAVFCQTDVASPEQVKKMVALAIKEYGKLDTVCNFAGMVRPVGSVVEEDLETWDRTIAVNLRGVYLCCHHGIPEIIKSGGGSIVNMSAVIAIRGGGPPMTGACASYASAKAGVIALTNSIAYSHGHHQIRANAILPGLVESGMSAFLFESAKFREMAVDSIPLRRWGQPEEVASVALFFASDDSSYVSGQAIVVDGACHLSQGTVYGAS